MIFILAVSLLAALFLAAPALAKGGSQGAIFGSITIDYKTPGTGLGTIYLTVTRGNVSLDYETQIDWGLSDEEAYDYIFTAFEEDIATDFGIEVQAFKLIQYNFDPTTYITTATFKAIRGQGKGL